MKSNQPIRELDRISSHLTRLSLATGQFDSGLPSISEDKRLSDIKQTTTLETQIQSETARDRAYFNGLHTPEPVDALLGLNVIDDATQFDAAIREFLSLRVATRENESIPTEWIDAETGEFYLPSKSGYIKVPKAAALAYVFL